MAVALATITQRPGARQRGLLVDVWHPKIGALTDHIEAEGPFPHRTFGGMGGTAPLGQGSGAVPGGPALRGTGPALEEQIGDARAGRDGRRGFVNARPDSHSARAGRPATCHRRGSDRPQWAPAGRRAKRTDNGAARRALPRDFRAGKRAVRSAYSRYGQYSRCNTDGGGHRA